MALQQTYIEDVVGGGITVGVSALIIGFADKRDLLKTPEELVTVGFIVIGVFYFVKFVCRWIYFFWVSDRRASCGLFIESYIAETKDGEQFPVIAPMVAYLDLWRDEIVLSGHAFKMSNETGRKEVKFTYHARWQSVAVHCKPRKDDISVFYLHDGELIGADNDDIPGTTFCRLPKKAGINCRRGYFCDFVNVNASLESESHASVIKTKYFEIARAPDAFEGRFREYIRQPFERFLCALRIGSPGEDVFQSFIKSHGFELMIDEAMRGPVMVNANNMLGIK